MPSTRSGWPTGKISAACSIFACVGLAAGCKSSGSPQAASKDKAAVHVLSPADFVSGSAGGSDAVVAKPAPAAPSASTTQAPAAASAGTTSVAGSTPTPAGATAAKPSTTGWPAKPSSVHETIQIGADSEVDVGGAAPLSTTAVSTEAPTPNVNAKAVDKGLVVDAIVGQINGRPVFASEILEPLDGRLRALSDSAKTRRDFVNEAMKLIGGEIERRVEDELFLSEARSNLTPDQRVGLFHFIDEIRNSLVSQQRGSDVAADEALRQSQGKGLTEKAKDVLDQELIQNEIRERISPRVQVSWRDIQQRYERDFEKYNPPAIAHLRLIVITGPGKTEDLKLVEAYQEKIKTVSAALAAATPFASVAGQAPNEFGRRDGGKKDTTLTDDYAKSKLLADDEVNRAAQGLQPSQWTGPITYIDKGDRRERTVWIFLDSVERPPAVPLSDAQLQIDDDIRKERFRRELNKYVDGLKRRGNISDIQQMTDTLVNVATERYIAPSRK